MPTLSSSSFYFYFYFSCFMLLMLLAKIFMFILNNICHTLLSIIVLRIWVLNQTTFPTGTFPYPRPPPPPPPFCLKCIAVVRRSFFLVSTVIERIKRDKQLLMFNWSDSRQGENALNTKLLQFLSFIKLCDSKSSDLTLSLPCVTKTEFLLTISIQHQTGKWWEYRKISLREL